VVVHLVVAVEQQITVILMVPMVVAAAVQELQDKVPMVELVLVLGTQVLVEVLEVQDALTRLLVDQDWLTALQEFHIFGELVEAELTTLHSKTTVAVTAVVVVVLTTTLVMEALAVLMLELLVVLVALTAIKALLVVMLVLILALVVVVVLTTQDPVVEVARELL
jgi:hypothetical protein